jgi:two-component system, NarL family, invasion response regulator UvrY
MKVLVVDDHAVVRAGFAKLFAERPDTFVRYATTGRDALDVVRDMLPDVIILDLDLPDVSGFALLKRLLRQANDARVLIVTMYSDIGYVDRAIEMGATGYVTKNAGPDELLTAVEEAFQRRRYIEASICQHMVHRSLERQGHGQDLSSRDIDVIRLLADGKSVGQIADIIGVSYKTVANNCSMLKAKLGLYDIKDLIRYAVTWKLRSKDRDFTE